MATLCVSRMPSAHAFLPQPRPRVSKEACPDKPVAEVCDCLLPLVSFACAAPGGFQQRVRSFGDLQVVPDLTDGDGGWLSGASDEEGGVEPGSDALVPVVPSTPMQGASLVDAILLAGWEERMEAGLFRYDVTACPTKPVPGVYGFIAQFNEGRALKKRPTEFCVDKVVQAFDEAKFNFKKVVQREVLFQFQPRPTDAASGIKALRFADEGLAYSEEGAVGVQVDLAAEVVADANLVLINVSPIEYGHVLLVPRALAGLPQVVDHPSVLLALQLCHEADNPYFRLAFNSLGAYGTINHLHFQAYYLAAPFAVERAPTLPLVYPVRAKHSAPSGVRIAQLTGYPVRGLVFEAGVCLAELAGAVASACARLTAANVPHNLFIVDFGQRVFLFPNAYAGAKAAGRVPEDLLDMQVDPAAFEISGHIIFKRRQDYEDATQASVWRLLSHASYSEVDFARLVGIALAG